MAGMNAEAGDVTPESEQASAISAALVADLKSICGVDGVSIDADARAFHSQDVYERGEIAAAVVSPATCQELQSVMRLAAAANVPLYVRGGGMSYTRAYLPESTCCLLLDTTRMNRIHTISAEDGYVTVDCGCTWEQLDEALAAHGVRTTFWGPFSGGRATVGGSFSQGSATFGSGQTGTTAPAALGFTIVTGDGELLRTGMDAQPGHLPFFRPYGPDITGLFTHDAGALGIKAMVTLALEERPAAYGGLSLAFADFESMFAAMRAAARTGLASELIGMDAAIAGIQAGERGLLADFRKLITIISGAHSLLRGLGRGIRAVAGGRTAFADAAFTAHFIADARSDRLLHAKVAELRSAVQQYGQEIPDAAIGMIRAQPFPQLPLTDMQGRRMLPIHGILPNSAVTAFRADYRAYLDTMQSRMSEAGITVVETFAGLGRNGFLYEPVWYWEDRLELFHERVSPAQMLKTLPRYPDNPEARELVEAMKQAVIDIMYRHGAAHLQVGRVYPYLRERDATSTALLQGVKALVDESAMINPRSLGL
ncbi:MAG: FAD-binding oxidoreductase [Chromatocurvus sp.]